MPTPSIPYDFQSRLNLVGDRMKTVNRNSLQVIRAGKQIVINNFNPATSDLEQLALYGLTAIAHRLQDFIFDTKELRTFDPDRPLEDDIFMWRGRQYSVLSIGEEIYRYTTSSRKRIRVHTKQVAGFKDKYDTKA